MLWPLFVVFTVAWLAVLKPFGRLLELVAPLIGRWFMAPADRRFARVDEELSS